MNTHQEIAPGVNECILDAFLVSFIHQNRGRSPFILQKIHVLTRPWQDALK
jgi:hypothetical protein